MGRMRSYRGKLNWKSIPAFVNLVTVETMRSGAPINAGMEAIVTAWNSLRHWLRANSAALLLCLRMTVAGALAYLLAALFELPQGYWAVFSAIIIMQASVGGSVKATLDRLIGTLGGAVAGGVVAYFIPHDGLISLGIGLVVALAPLTLLAALRPNYRIAPLTAVIVLLTPGAQQLGPLASALNRILEISLGSVVGLGVALLLMPARAHGLVINAAARMLGLLADLLHDWLAVLGGNADRSHIAQLQDDIRAGMARLEIAAGEARQERRTYLTREFDPDPLVRTVFRLRNDLIIIGRAAADPLPDAIITRLRDPLGQVSDAAQRYLREAGEALLQRKIPPPLGGVENTLQDFIAVIEVLRREGTTRALPADSVGRLFALGFALEQLRRNFEDFGDRVTECARADAAT
jgi:uncharacterized membrane protein YccC